MKRALIMTISLFLLQIANAQNSEDSKMHTKKNELFYTMNVIKKYDTFYAEWIDFHDKETEDRYDAIECEVYLNNKKIGIIFLVQSWYQEDRKEFPKVRTSFKTKIFELDQYYAPVEHNNVNFNEIQIIE